MVTCVESSDTGIVPSVSSVHVAPASVYVSPTFRLIWAKPFSVIMGLVVSGGSTTVMVRYTGVAALPDVSVHEYVIV